MKLHATTNAVKHTKAVRRDLKRRYLASSPPHEPPPPTPPGLGAAPKWGRSREQWLLRRYSAFDRLLQLRAQAVAEDREDWATAIAAHRGRARAVAEAVAEARGARRGWLFRGVKVEDFRPFRRLLAMYLDEYERAVGNAMSATIAAWAQRRLSGGA